MAANPFDQFDTAEANPFDQFDTAAPPDEYQRKEYKLSEVPGAALSNIGESTKKFIGGVVDTAKTALTTPILQRIVNMYPDVAIAHAKKIGGVYKDRYGDYESLKRTVAEDPVGAAADLSAIFGGAELATARAAPSVSKAAAVASKYTNPTTLAMPAIELPFKLGAKGAGVVYNMLDPKLVAYMEAAEGRAPEIANALRGQTTIVPGSVPTAAQAAATVSGTKFAALGEEAKKVLPTEYFDRAAAQKEAQLAAIRGIGQTPEALSTAENLRRATAGDLYAQAGKKTAKTNEELNVLLARPSMDKVISRAANIAAERQIPFQIGKNVPAKTTPSALVDEFGRPLGEVTTPAEVAKYPGTSIHSMKMAFDDLIKNPEQFGIGAAEVNAISDTRKKFMDWAEKSIPEYKEARETYAKQSKPINQMEVGQFLEKKLTPALGEETAKLRASGFATAVEEAPRTIKKSTGQDRFTELSQVLEPDQLAAVNAVRDDLARAQQAEFKASAGMATAPKLGALVEDVAGAVRAPNFLSKVTTVANAIMRRVQGKLDKKLAIELATEMLNPDTTAAAIDKAILREAKGKARAATAAEIGGAVSNALRSPFITAPIGAASTNALRPQ
jgi:hypothetical protein